MAHECYPTTFSEKVACSISKNFSNVMYSKEHHRSKLRRILGRVEDVTCILVQERFSQPFFKYQHFYWSAICKERFLCNLKPCIDKSAYDCQKMKMGTFVKNTLKLLSALQRLYLTWLC